MTTDNTQLSEADEFGLKGVEFDARWREHWQFVRSGGGECESCFAYAAWQAARAGDGKTLSYSVDAEDSDEMDRQLEEAWSENEALKDELATLQRDYARALDSIKGHVAWIKAQEQHIRELRAFQAMVNRHAPDCPAHSDDCRDVWYWQGDGRDHLESMTHQLPVVIRAEQLRELLAAAPAAPSSAPAAWLVRSGKLVEQAYMVKETADYWAGVNGGTVTALYEGAAPAAAPASDVLRKIVAITSRSHGMTERELGLSMGRIQEICEAAIPGFRAPAVSAPAGPDARDAARYRVLREGRFSFCPRITDPTNEWLTYTPEGLDKVCDEMVALSGDKKGV